MQHTLLEFVVANVKHIVKEKVLLRRCQRAGFRHQRRAGFNVSALLRSLFRPGSDGLNHL
jgi:hypothetical protein